MCPTPTKYTGFDMSMLVVMGDNRGIIIRVDKKTESLPLHLQHN